MEYLVAFNSTHQAMQSEKIIKENHLKGRLIPTPESISASCGLALKFDQQILAELTILLKKTSVEISGLYKIEILAHRKHYVRLSSTRKA